jgi:hypothetical protein
MWSFITNGCLKQILFVCCTYKEQSKAYKHYSTNGMYTKQWINEKMVILEKFRKKYQIWTNNDEEILVTAFDCWLKREIRTILHLNRTSPTVISDAGLITRVGFAALPKFYTDNSCIIQKLIYYWFPIPILRLNFTISQWSLKSSLQNREFEVILYPHRSSRRYLCKADRCAPVPEAAVVHPKCAKSKSGSHARPSRAKADTPRCSAISTLYCRRPRPTSCNASRCRQRRHYHCLYRSRWRIDRPPHRAHPRRRARDHCIPCFPWSRLWSRRRSKPPDSRDRSA